MIEVIPNWHPLFVHFPIALLSMATLFFLVLKVMGNHPIKEQIKIFAFWNLWLGTGFAIIAAIAGWFAYNSVAHDTPSHEAMTEHRNWALVTLTVFILISLWSKRYYKQAKEVGITFVTTMIVGFSLLASTGWHGSEAVYRFGLGVMSLPQIEGEGHAHEHADGEGHSSGHGNKIIEKPEVDEHMHESIHQESLTTKTKDKHNHSDHKH